ncbi:hypothetical protein UA08_04523 [Talaromyces atroroseus]|uniref:Uncharacterized protein n=1 Tax=Talaromyces atroroseus TaxID=1441469 RepID=A0A225AES7_TALAT|nr:hypothetical protein UA08_04523 [Talaromyces atroroseus]OKL59791.1 hypothetical protein UA08_04523 [Talaromyces atroroseus]
MVGELPEQSKASLEDSLESLTIQKHKPDPDIARLAVSKTQPPKTGKGGDEGKKKTKKKEIVADSWEDEMSSSEAEPESEKEDERVTTAKPGVSSLASKSEGPLAPPPTPAPNTYYNTSPHPTATATSDRSTRTVRPEKQTAVASRMIAGALGIRAPKRTEEQRAYDRAMKEKEMKRRNREKEEEAKAKQEEERAKAAVWDA